jgi:dTDP-glucose 4,6-dehydratase
MVCAQLGANFDDVVNVTDDRPGKDAAYTLDSTRARTDLAWRDTISLEEGVRDTIAWVESNLAELQRQPLDYLHKP